LNDGEELASYKEDMLYEEKYRWYKDMQKS